MNVQDIITDAEELQENLAAKIRRSKREEELWDKTLDIECEVCMGRIKCPECAGPVLHFAEYVYPIMIHLMDMDMPKHLFEEFTQLLNNKDFWLEAAHYTICQPCESIDIITETFGIFHRRSYGKNSLEVLRFRSKENCHHSILFSAEWLSMLPCHDTGELIG